MAYDPYNDPNRIARQQREQMARVTEQMHRNSQKISEQMTRDAAAAQQRVAQQTFQRSRRDSEQRLTGNAELQRKRFNLGVGPSDSTAQPARRKRGRFLGWLLVFGVIGYGAWRMFGH